MNDDWQEDTTDVLHCSMPPQVRAHIEELRDEVARLRGHPAAFATVVSHQDGMVAFGSDEYARGIDLFVGAPPSPMEVEAGHMVVALIPADSRTRT